MKAHNHDNIFETSSASLNDPRYRLMRSTIYWSVAISLVITALKLSAWLLTNSTSLQAVFVDSLMDVVASVAAIFAISIAQKPADERHSFGHSKAESVASIGQTMLVFCSGALLMAEAFKHVFNQEQVKETGTGIWLILVSSLFLIFLIFIQRYAMKRTKSLLVKSVAIHYEGDIALNFGAILAIWISDSFNLHYIDIAFGVGVAIYIFYNAVQVFLTAAKDLMDEELPKEQKDQIYAVAKSVSGIKSIARLQTRSAAHKKFIIMEIKMDKSLSLIDADSIVKKTISNMKAEIKDSEITIRPLPD
ncbi:MAG: cation diffusion facilitator family transporter [Holosporales bacterium]|jgi:ferrous-iron efflux pump FieF|nr:cation diffusion facilitator family transporter [Holosporales bacterium]